VKQRWDTGPRCPTDTLPGVSATTLQPQTDTPQRLRWRARLLHKNVVFGAFLVFLLCHFAAHNGVSDPDIWWHLRNASLLVHSGHFIHTDTLTYTVAGKPWVNFEWLAELPYYFADAWLGLSGLYITMLLLAAAIVVGVYRLALLRSQDALAACLASLVAVLCTTVSLAPRTLLFGWLCLVVELGILWQFQNGKDRTGWLPVLFALWINLHGSWFLGFALMLIFIACGFFEGQWGALFATRWTGNQRRRLAIVTAASAAALFANPYGWRLVAYPLDALVHGNLGMQYIAEWASLNFHTGLGKTVLAMLLLLALLQLLREQRWSLQDLALAAVGVYGALTYVRFVFLCGILVAPLLARSLRLSGLRPEEPGRESPFLNAAVLAILAVLIAISYPHEKKLQEGIAKDFPEKALPRLQALADKGHVLNEYSWGGYLEWRAPEVKTFIDPRADIFVQNGIMADYAKAAHVEDTFAILYKYRIDYVLMPRSSPFAYVVAHSPAWKTLYDDGQASIFERVH
jgi:hypothetical protein